MKFLIDLTLEILFDIQRKCAHYAIVGKSWLVPHLWLMIAGTDHWYCVYVVASTCSFFACAAPNVRVGVRQLVNSDCGFCFVLFGSFPPIAVGMISEFCVAKLPMRLGLKLLYAYILCKLVYAYVLSLYAYVFL